MVVHVLQVGQQQYCVGQRARLRRQDGERLSLHIHRRAANNNTINRSCCVAWCFNKCPHSIQQMLLTHTQTRRGCSAAHGRRGRPRTTRTARDALASATATLAPTSSARPRPACPKACTSPVEKAPPPYRNKYIITSFFLFHKSLAI